MEAGLEEVVEILRNFLEEHDLPRRAQACYQCGSCAGGCPVGRLRWEFNPRRFIEMVLRGRLEEIVEDRAVWLCAYCLTCLEHCPQKIEVSEVMVQLKNAVARMGSAPESEVKKGGMIMVQGWIDVPASRTLKKRGELGLPAPAKGIAPDELTALGRILDWPAKRLRFRNSGPADAGAWTGGKEME
jgi:heterodisulfide reductase subunit C